MNVRLVQPEELKGIIDETIRRAEVIVVCSKSQAIQDEQGDLFDPVQSGVISWEKVQELADLFNGRVPGRTSDRQTTGSVRRSDGQA
jgi:ornithine cyclodeaminase/alanine dehydrogenase-like protein (mu-crystallin family)